MDVQRRKKNRGMNSAQLPLIGDGDHRVFIAGLSKKECYSYALLLFLYMLQGIPLGMIQAFQLFLQEKKVTYREQALFSSVLWPFSLKILWAPLVDFLFVKRFGRRKTWLVPTQYLLGALMLILSYQLDTKFESSQNPDVFWLTCVFFVLTFLAATQDIAVDGWALTMFSRRNIGHASTCNSVGQTAGYFFSTVLFVALDSPEVAGYFEPGRTKGLIPKDEFIFFWGVVFMVATTLVALLKGEEESHEDIEDIGIVQSYLNILRTLCKPLVFNFAIFLATCKIGFAVADNIYQLKMIEAGASRFQFTMTLVPLLPVQLILPLIISKYTVGETPLGVMIRAYPYRYLMTLISAVYVWYAFTYNGEIPVPYLLFGLCLYLVYQALLNCCYVSMMAFFAKISDPNAGGTYMTLFNTLFNFGGVWPGTVSLWVLDYLSVKSCSMPNISCVGKENECSIAGGSCKLESDGVYMESVIFMAVGFLWYFAYGKRFMLQAQRKHPNDFRL